MAARHRMDRIMIILKTIYKDGESQLAELPSMQDADKRIDQLNAHERPIIEHIVYRMSMLYKMRSVNDETNKRTANI